MASRAEFTVTGPGILRVTIDYEDGRQASRAFPLHQSERVWALLKALGYVTKSWRDMWRDGPGGHGG